MPASEGAREGGAATIAAADSNKKKKGKGLLGFEKKPGSDSYKLCPNRKTKKEVKLCSTPDEKNCCIWNLKILQTNLLIIGFGFRTISRPIGVEFGRFLSRSLVETRTTHPEC